MQNDFMQEGATIENPRARADAATPELLAGRLPCASDPRH